MFVEAEVEEKKKRSTLSCRRLEKKINQSTHLCLLPDLLVARRRSAVERVDTHGLGLAVEDLVHALLERAHAGDHDGDENEGERRFCGHLFSSAYYLFLASLVWGRKSTFSATPLSKRRRRAEGVKEERRRRAEGVKEERRREEEGTQEEKKVKEISVLFSSTSMRKKVGKKFLFPFLVSFFFFDRHQRAAARDSFRSLPRAPPRSSPEAATAPNLC